MIDKKKDDKKDKPRGRKGPDKIGRTLDRKPAWDRKGKADQENR